MARNLSHLSVFVPLPLREALELSAHENDRSLTAEVRCASARTPPTPRAPRRPLLRCVRARWWGEAVSAGVISATDYFMQRMLGPEAFQALVQVRSRSRPISLEEELVDRTRRGSRRARLDLTPWRRLTNNDFPEGAWPRVVPGLRLLWTRSRILETTPLTAPVRRPSM